ncbi:MAG TPA: hypothetical protein VKV04_03160 [Verrucomicrobiae bacterium]|nr:hypothetical protein [Verrucomicrobiae bacterium]
MIKTLIIIVVAVAVGFGGWQVYDYWLKVQDEKAAAEKEAASKVVDGNTLSGVPYELQDSLQAAEQHGAVSLGGWLKLYDSRIQDPKKAWIELDYVVMITRDNPKEARRLFGEVKDRTLPNSPVWPRIQGMEKTYD